MGEGLADVEAEGSKERVSGFERSVACRSDATARTIHQLVIGTPALETTETAVAVWLFVIHHTEDNITGIAARGVENNDGAISPGTTPSCVAGIGTGDREKMTIGHPDGIGVL